MTTRLREILADVQRREDAIRASRQSLSGE